MLYLFLGEPCHFWHPDVHPQRLLTTQEVVKLSIVVLLTAYSEKWSVPTLVSNNHHTRVPKAHKI